MIERIEHDRGNVLAFRMSGKLHDEDYQHFVPMVEDAIEKHGAVRLLAQFHDFHGWDLKALWDDIKFSAKHCNDIERIAMVGDQKWQEWMAKICKPFTQAKVEYFSDTDSAFEWLEINE